MHNPKTRACPNTIFWASVVINTEYSKFRREGAEHILLIKAGICASVCLFGCRELFIQLTSRVAGAMSHFGAIWARDTFKSSQVELYCHSATCVDI